MQYIILFMQCICADPVRQGKPPHDPLSFPYY